MQVRKLIRILQEEIKKDPSVAYMKVCVDARYTNPRFSGDVTFKEIQDAQVHWCVWNPGDFDTERQRQVMVIGNY